jgi:hypothetical protein
VSLSGFLFKTAGDPVLLAEGIRKGYLSEEEIQARIPTCED